MPLPDPADWTRSLLEGYAQHLHDAGVGVWSPSVPYGPDDVGIVVGRLPDSPDRVIGLAPYSVDASGMAHRTQGIQVRCRGPVGAGIDGPSPIADAVYHATHRASGLSLGGVPVTLMTVQSVAWLGADDADRDETTVNVYLVVTQPSAYVNE